MNRKLLVLIGTLGLMALLVGSCTQSDSATPENDSDDIGQIQLRDWMPKSIHKAGNSEVEKAKYPVIDLHAHAYAKTEEEVDKRVEIMDGY